MISSRVKIKELEKEHFYKNDINDEWHKRFVKEWKNSMEYMKKVSESVLKSMMTDFSKIQRIKFKYGWEDSPVIRNIIGVRGEKIEDIYFRSKLIFDLKGGGQIEIITDASNFYKMVNGDLIDPCIISSEDTGKELYSGEHRYELKPKSDAIRIYAIMQPRSL